MNPLDALSPIIIAQVKYPESPTLVERAKWRGRVRRQVSTCTSCELHKVTTPIPYSGPTTARFVAIGEAPGPQEAKRGQPFIGPAGRLLRVLFAETDIDPDDDVIYANTISCFPTKGDDGATIRAPSPTEQKACYSNLIAQASVAYSPFVLLVGAKALNTFRSDLRVTEDHGKVFVWNDTYVVMAIHHPAAILRGQSGYKQLVREDLARWHDIVYSGDDPLSWIDDACIKCGGVATMWDRDAVPYCDKHWKVNKDAWEKERRRWTEAPVVQLTF